MQSAHGSFRPVDVKLGPDGALYICDWYNPIIGHYQASFRHPDRDKAHGRIWRVTYKGRPLLTPPPALDAGRTRSGRAVRTAALARSLPARAGEAHALRRRHRGGDECAAHAGTSSSIPNAPDLDFALMQALGVFEAHEAVELSAAQARARREDARGARLRRRDARPLGRTACRSDFDPLETARRSRARRRPARAPRGHRRRGEYPARRVDGRGAERRDAAARPFHRHRARRRDQRAQAAVGTRCSPKARRTGSRNGSSWSRRSTNPRRKPAPARKVRSKSARRSCRSTAGCALRPTSRAASPREVLTKGDAKRGAEIYRRARTGVRDAATASARKAARSARRSMPSAARSRWSFIIGTVIEPQREVKEGFETDPRDDEERRGSDRHHRRRQRRASSPCATPPAPSTPSRRRTSRSANSSARSCPPA